MTGDDPGDIYGVSPTQLRVIEERRLSETARLLRVIASLRATIGRLERMYDDKSRRERGM
jgi:hypothetical protein